MAGNSYVRIRGLGQVKKSTETGIRGVFARLVTRRASPRKKASGDHAQSFRTIKAIEAARGSHLVNVDLGRLLR